MTKKLSLHLSLFEKSDAQRSRWTPAQTGTQRAIRLVKQAHETYKAEVSAGLAKEPANAMRLISFIQNQFHDEKCWSKNEHQKNYYTATDLLREHEKLVYNISTTNKLDDAEIADLLNGILCFEPTENNTYRNRT